jgi:iron complex transport system substrate-binding protein
VSFQEIVDAAPEVIFIAPCGYNAEQARDEYLSLAFPEEWYAIPAVRDGRVFALDANGHVSRPAGRLVTGTESMAKGMHPELEVPVKAMLGMLSVPTTKNRTAVAGAPSF